MPRVRVLLARSTRSLDESDKSRKKMLTFEVWKNRLTTHLLVRFRSWTAPVILTLGYEESDIAYGLWLATNVYLTTKVFWPLSLSLSSVYYFFPSKIIEEKSLFFVLPWHKHNLQPKGGKKNRYSVVRAPVERFLSFLSYLVKVECNTLSWSAWAF